MTQQPLPLGDGHYARRANAISRRVTRKRTRLPIIQPTLIADRNYQPEAGVPATRGECPTMRPCPYVRCRMHLFAESAEHRAGRPGLANVPRDSKGRTQRTEGQAGQQRAGTTLRPSWLKVRGLEIEREVKLNVWHGPDGVELHEVRNGTLDYWRARLHEGEPVLVFDDDTAGLVAKARLEGERAMLDRELPDSTFMVVLTRVRGVSSCALDEAELGARTNTQIGDAIGRHRTLTGRIVPSAMARAIEVAEEMGMSEHDLARGLRELGAGG